MGREAELPPVHVELWAGRVTQKEGRDGALSLPRGCLEDCAVAACTSQRKVF